MSDGICQLCVSMNRRKATETVTLITQGRSYDVDLCPRHVAVVNALFAPVVDPNAPTAAWDRPNIPAHAPKRRGRPPKAKPEQAVATAEIPAAVPENAPKRRGRPPKAKPEQAAAAAETPAAVTENAPKRRGRPPKVKPENVAETPASTSLFSMPDTQAARPVATAPAASVPLFSSPLDMSAVRAWAKTQNIEVGDRGRIPVTVQQAYVDSHPKG